MALHPVIIIPTYNEVETLPTLVASIYRQLPNAHILVVDDNSKDGTAEWVQSQPHFNDALHLLSRPRKLGLGTAYIAGFKWALQHHYDVIFEMDADGSHQPKHLPAMLNAIEDGADVVIGSRYIPEGKTENWPWHRKLISYLGNVYAKKILRLPVKDATGGFKAFHKKVLANMPLNTIRSNGFAFQVEINHLAHKKKFNILEVPITFIERLSGQSKMSLAIALEAFWLVWCFKFRKY